MTREEHLQILDFIERTVSGAQPPMDVEADAIIRAMFVRRPDAAYRMTRLAMSLAAEAEARTAPVEAPAARRGWLSGIFDREERAQVRREPIVS